MAGRKRTTIIEIRFLLVGVWLLVVDGLVERRSESGQRKSTTAESSV